MTEGLKGKPGSTKAMLLMTLFLKEPLRKSEIIGSFTKQSSKGVYRHLRDLESEKIIKTVKTKGGLPICKLNKNLNSLAKVFDYWFVYPGIKEAFDRAFAECFTSPLGDFLYSSFREVSLTEKKWYITALGSISKSILEEGKRPFFTEKQLVKINRVAGMLRGPMDTAYKLAYIGLVWMLYDMPDSEFMSIPVHYGTTLNSRKEMITGLQGKGDTFNYVVVPVFDAVEEIVKMFTIRSSEGKEVHFLGAVTDREKLINGITNTLLRMEILTVNDFQKRFKIIKIALKDLVPGF